MIAQHKQTRVINMSRKREQLDFFEKETNQLLHTTRNNPTAGMPIEAERAVSSNGRCHHLII